VAAVVAVPTIAEAQRRRAVVVRRPPAVRSVVFIGPYSYPRYHYSALYQWGWGYPVPPYGYGYGYGWFNEFNASIRLQVTPKEAEVFVDGYRAGTVEDFDGIFQRLRVRPGGHEITVYLEGYETVEEAVYLEAGADRKLQFALNRLPAGQRAEPPPSPAPMAGTRTMEFLPDPPPEPRAPSAEGRGESRQSTAPGRFGTLSLRVQPADAEIIVDGERWAAPAGQDRMAIQLSEGRHRIEVRRDGMNTYSEDVLIRRGATLTLNVSLK
jgi:hypothetical protein